MHTFLNAKNTPEPKKTRANVPPSVLMNSVARVYSFVSGRRLLQGRGYRPTDKGLLDYGG